MGLLVVAVEVAHQISQMGLALGLAHNRLMEVGTKVLESAALPNLPEVSGQVEDKGLDEQHEHHPLVVANVAPVFREHRATHQF